MQLNMLEAKTQLSKLVEAAMQGEEVIIANRGKPMVRLVKAELPAKKRVWGQWEGLMTDEEVDRAFTPEADARIAAAFLGNVQRRALRAAEIDRVEQALETALTPNTTRVRKK
jgi:prevent-host-death family protein